MYQDYDNAVGKVNKYLTENHFLISVIYSHLNCYRSFKQYLEEKNVPYSHDEAIIWLKSNKQIWKHSKFKMSRLSLFQFDDVMRNGCITTNSYVYENSYNYDRLLEWCRLLLNDYQNNISYSFHEGYVKQHRIACSEFLIYINSIGGKNAENINHKNVIGYYYQSEHRTLQAKNLYNRSIRHFLQYLANRSLIPASLTYALNQFVIPRIIIIDEFSDEERKACGHCLDQTLDGLSTTEYYSIAKELGDAHLDCYNYSKTMKKIFRKTWRELYVFLEANRLNYSYKVAEYWCFYLKNYTVQWKAYRRAIKLFEQYRACGNINPNIVYSYKEDSINMLPEWSRSLLLNFLLKSGTKKIQPPQSACTVARV